MSSPLSDALNKAVNKKVEEFEEKSKNKFEIALEKTEERVRQKVDEILERDGLDFYYSGYKPHMYVRTNQLRDSGAVSAKTESFNKNGMMGFSYGAVFNEDLMDHSVYELHMVYKHKKDGGKWERNYTYYDDDVDEKKILDNFRFGLHPLGVPGAYIDQGIIWKTEEEGGREGRVVDKIKKWKQSGAIKDIFLEELQKLKK